jgi:hypothetical protein
LYKVELRSESFSEHPVQRLQREHLHIKALPDIAVHAEAGLCTTLQRYKLRVLDNGAGRLFVVPR